MDHAVPGFYGDVHFPERPILLDRARHALGDERIVEGGGLVLRACRGRSAERKEQHRRHDPCGKNRLVGHAPQCNRQGAASVCQDT